MSKLPFRRLSNAQFQRLFFKNTLSVFLSISVPLLISVLAVYSYCHSSLMAETDAANLRSLENTRATVEMIVGETESMLLRYASSDDLNDLLRITKEQFPDYSFIRSAREQIKIMSLAARPYLDHAITAYSEVSDFTFSSLLGGQACTYFSDQTLLPTYRTLKEEEPSQSTYCVLRQADYLDYSPWVLTFYRTIPTPSSPENTFIAIDVSVNMLRSYLTDSTSSENGAILILDAENHILFDSTGEHLGASLSSLFEEGSESDSFLSGEEGAATFQVDGSPQRVSWLPLEQTSLRGLKCVQLVPFDDYYEGMSRLRGMLMLTVFIGMILSVVIAYFTSRRLFRPVSSILEIIENPDAFNERSDRSGEIGYLLMRVVSSFQKNLTLENEMVEKMTALRNARAQALQEQMTPHFLYNALQAINWLALSETQLEESRTSASIVTLAELVRTCMEQSDNFTTVAEEIAHVKKYMQIEQLRFGDGISCKYEVDQAALPLKILRISLQPLVENAISHGLKPHGCAGQIEVRVAAEGKMLRCSVEDDGVGMPPDRMQELLQSCKTEYVYANQHVGLVNLSQRIKLVYGEQYELTLQKGRCGGLRVEFVVPQVE